MLKHMYLLLQSQKPSTNMFDSLGLPNAEPSQLSSERLIRDRMNYDHEMLRLMFAHLRRQMQMAVDANVAIEQDVTKYIISQVNTNDYQIIQITCLVSAGITFCVSHFGSCPRSAFTSDCRSTSPNPLPSSTHISQTFCGAN